MKKIFAALVLVVVCAGSAFAFPQGPAGVPMGPGPAIGQQREMTPEMKAKFEQLRKLHEELRAEMQSETPDKAKARETHAKIVSLQDEMENARFEKMLSEPKSKDAQKLNKDGKFGPRPELTAAQKAKMEALKKLDKQIHDEFAKDKPDKTMIRNWSKQAQKIRNAMDDERLEQMLKDPSKYKNMPGFGPGSGGPRGPRPAPDQQADGPAEPAAQQ